MVGTVGECGRTVRWVGMTKYSAVGRWRLLNVK